MTDERARPAGWSVRRASAGDVDAVAAVAKASWTDAYAGVLHPATITAFLEAAYSRPRLGTRIASNHFGVALDGSRVMAFADASVGPERIVLNALYTLPEIRGRGAGTALLRTLLLTFPSLAMTADVVVGNRKGEAFYERRGFVPRETIRADLFGEVDVERRWWRDPAQSGSQRRTALDARSIGIPPVSARPGM